MTCCGQKRAMLSGPAAPSTTGHRSPTVEPASAAAASVAIRSLAARPVLVRGPLTGRAYAFPGAHAVVAVDPRDAAALLRTRFFARG
jgi:hypothetical protein